MYPKLPQMPLLFSFTFVSFLPPLDLFPHNNPCHHLIPLDSLDHDPNRYLYLYVFFSHFVFSFSSFFLFFLLVMPICLCLFLLSSDNQHLHKSLGADKFGQFTSDLGFTTANMPSLRGSNRERTQHHPNRIPTETTLKDS